MLTITNEDNMKMMARYPDKHFDLAIVDPPYGIHDKLNRPGETGKLKNRALHQYQYNTWDKAIPTEEYFNELFRVSKNQIIWGGNYFPLPPTRGIIAWDKCQPWPNFSAWEMGWTSFDKVAKMLNLDNRTGGKIHPTQKPVLLYAWCLSNYAKKGDKILDTHLGSMSIAIACADYGFDLYGCELDTDYYNKGIERVENHINQLGIFTEKTKLITQI